jgi:hypothetical protein
MASGPWFYFQEITVKGVPGLGDRNVVYGRTDVQLTPPFPNPPDPPISANSWVWASISEQTPSGESHFGDAGMWIGNVVPQNDGSVWVRVFSAWTTDLPGIIKLLFWSEV